MNIYYKENIGLKTAQEYNTDYFTIRFIGAKLLENKAHAELIFWERLEDAQKNKTPNLSRTVEWDIVKETSIDSGVNTLFTSDSLETTNGEVITLKGATLVE